MKKLIKKAKHNDAVMTGILVTKFKMGQIDGKDLERMAADVSRAERCSAAKKVLEALKDSPDLLRPDALQKNGGQNVISEMKMKQLAQVSRY